MKREVINGTKSPHYNIKLQIDPAKLAASSEHFDGWIANQHISYKNMLIITFPSSHINIQHYSQISTIQEVLNCTKKMSDV